MGLPIFTTGEDVIAIVDYLKTKATGTTIDDAKAVLGGKLLDPRKLTAYTAWGIIQRDGDRIKLDGIGRELARARADQREAIMAKCIGQLKTYANAVEWIFYQNFSEVTTVEIAAYWHERHRNDIGTDNENTIKDMAVCFFRLMEASGLGTMTAGRHGQSTRFTVSRDAIGQFIGGAALEQGNDEYDKEIAAATCPVVQPAAPTTITPMTSQPELPPVASPIMDCKQRVFISHGKNMEIVEQIKTMLDLADLQYEVVVEEESSAIPVPEKVFSAMRRCTSAVICVTADENEKRDNGTYGINQNVLIEIGSAFVLYDRKVILVWDKRIPIPSNLQGLYRCEFSGDDLSWSTGMKLMKALSNFKNPKA